MPIWLPALQSILTDSFPTLPSNFPASASNDHFLNKLLKPHSVSLGSVEETQLKRKINSKGQSMALQ